VHGCRALSEELSESGGHGYLRPAADIILPQPEVFTLARIDGGGLSTPQSGCFRIASPLYLSPLLRMRHSTLRISYLITLATSYDSSVHHAPSAFCVYEILWMQAMIVDVQVMLCMARSSQVAWIIRLTVLNGGGVRFLPLQMIP